MLLRTVILGTVILIPPLYGGRRIHDTEASWMHQAALSWILRRSAPQNDNDGAVFRMTRTGA